LRTFGPGDYEQFARLAVGRGRFADWAALGALPDEPPGSAALLHHHLAESLQLPDAPAPAEATPLERLLALARPRESALSIRLEPQFAAAPPLRDLQVGPPRLPRPFRLGDPVRFAFRASAECAVALVDVGTTGKVAVALPNCWQPQARARAGEVCWLPDPAAGNFEFTLSGQGGRERVVALAWRGRPPVPLAPAGDAAFRTLGEADLAGLCDAVERLPPGEWAACLCEFEIVPGPGA
jgi:hypothetical protein